MYRLFRIPGVAYVLENGHKGFCAVPEKVRSLKSKQERFLSRNVAVVSLDSFMVRLVTSSMGRDHSNMILLHG